MKILHLLQSNRFSGAENVVCQIIDMFRDDPNVEMVYCSPEGSIKETLEKRNITFYPCKKMSLAEIRRVIKKVNPTVIHAHDMRATFLTALACGKIPFVSHMHSNNIDSRKLSLKSVLYCWAAKRARHIFWVSKSAFGGFYYRSQLASKSSVLQNMVDIEQIRERAASAERQEVYDAVYIGRLSYPKNPRRMISVLEKTVTADPSMRAAVIGDGELLVDVKEFLEQSAVQKQIHLLGFLENPLGIMKNAKVMIMTSLWEGMPISALEAMTLGVPLVCVPTDGLRDLVVSGETGFLSDDDDELAEYCQKIIFDSEVRENLSTASISRVEQLMDLAKYRGCIVEVYKKCIPKRRTRKRKKE